jgi:RNA polymerase sigma factor (TIGR02999 family)
MMMADPVSEKEMLQPGASNSALNLSKIMPAAYEELRRLARRYIAHERTGQTLQATALLNEAYIKLLKNKSPVWQNRAHFCAIAANAMRELLVERARAKAALKRGGSRVRVSLQDALFVKEAKEIDLLALHDALNHLAQFDSELARIVELRFFGGLTVEETAEALERSPATIKRGWSLARAWLRKELEASCES